MTDRTLTGGVRERDERDARFFAWDVPGDAHIVALVHEADDAERSATVADAIATSVARRREHTLLLSAEAGPSPLDELLGAAGSPGLPAALEGRARLTDVAVQRVDRPFVYLPGGSDPVAMRALLEHEVLASFVDRVRQRGGTLFIVLARETLLLDGLRALIDGYVALGDVTLPEPANELTQFGRVRYENGDGSSHETNGAQPRAVPDLPELPPLPELDAASEGTDSNIGRAAPAAPLAAPSTPDPALDDPGSEIEEPAIVVDPGDVEPEAADPASRSPQNGDLSDHWKRHRQDPAFPLRNVAIGVAAIAGVAALWWAIASGLLGGSNAAPGVVSGTGTPVAATQGPSPTAPADPVFDEAAARSAFDNAPELAYSVMIASFAASSDAEDRLLQLASSGDGFYFVAPTPVRGVVYHRVFAGALATREEAQQLMDALVANGVKDEAGAWHLRPAALAFDLGVFPDEAAGRRRVDELAAKAVPAYVLTAPDESGAVWRVYGGAYVDERESVPMSGLLATAGEPAELVTRRGLIP